MKNLKIMKKRYKLIKEYPRSPELDTIIEFNSGWGETQAWIEERPEEAKEYWEEVVEKSYQVLKMKNTSGMIYTVKEGEDLKFELIHHTIHSVKRLSDGEIFTVEDDFAFNGLRGPNSRFPFDKIRGFTFRQSGELAVKYSNGIVDINKIHHFVPPFLLSHDGVILNQGDEYYTVFDIDHSDSKCKIYGPFELDVLNNVFSNKCKFFASKEKANEYRKEQLLDEAKRRFPSGTKFKSTFEQDLQICYGVGEFIETHIGYDEEEYRDIIWSLDKHGNRVGWLYWDGKWAEVVKDKVVEDYEMLLLEDRKYTVFFHAQASKGEIYNWMKLYEPKLYWSKVLQLIADDLNGDWGTDWRNVNQFKHYIFYDYSGQKYRISYFSSTWGQTIVFKSREVAQRAIEIMGSKLDYIFKH